MKNKEQYAQNWSSYNKAQTNEKMLFMRLLGDLCNDIEQQAYKFGRPNLSLRDMVFCSVFKVFSSYSGRRFMTDLKMANEDGYIDFVPHYNSIFNYMKRPELTKLLTEMIVKCSLPLRTVESRFAVDSTGFSTTRYKRWFDCKYGEEHDFRIWIKAHIACGVKTNIITAVRISEAKANDHTFFRELINDTSTNFDVVEVSADKAYSSRDSYRFVDELGGTAFIPFKCNATGKQRGTKIWSLMYEYFRYRNDEFMKHYHLRSNVESTFSMIKRKFGDTIRSRDKTAQFNEVLCKFLCHNICVVIQEMCELGIEANFINSSQ